MQPRFVDLHTHTTASDGTDAPRDLIRRAASLKLAAVAVTDHDTVSGLDEAEAAGRGKGGLRVTVALLDALKARRKRPVDDAPEVL